MGGGRNSALQRPRFSFNIMLTKTLVIPGEGLSRLKVSYLRHISGAAPFAEKQGEEPRLGYSDRASNSLCDLPGCVRGSQNLRASQVQEVGLGFL